MSGILLPAGCCCGGGGSLYPCLHCTDKTPKTLSATFSSLTICTACYIIGGGPVSYKFTTAPPTPVGPYTLAQTGDRCVYEYSAAVSGQIDMYTVNDCTGEGYSYPLIDLVIRATFTANTIALDGWWTHEVSGPMAMYGPNTYFFSKTLTPVSVCDGPWTPANGLTACNTSGPSYMGHSGAASIVANF